MSRASYLNSYSPHFHRHLHNLAVSGFFARELDADDHEFIEQVRCRGIANGTLPNINTVLIEELEFWHLPYSVDWTISRKHGPVPMRGPPETAESRKARIQAWQARNAQRLANKAIADAELAREQAEWEAAQKRRKHREIFGDAEWEAADPKYKRKGKGKGRSTRVSANPYSKHFGTATKRHYVPQWKLDESEEAALIKRQDEARKAEQLKAAQQAARELAKKLQTERAERIASQKPAPDRPIASYNAAEVQAAKTAIKYLIRMSYPTVWTPERLTSALGRTDVQFIVHCAEEMVRAGELRIGVERMKMPA